MTFVAVGVAAAGIVVSLAGQKQASDAADKQAKLQQLAGQKNKEAAEFKARQLREGATAEVAAAQRDALDLDLVSKLTQSRALALSAASGGGAQAPGSLTVISKIAKRGAYNSAVALYNGETKARAMRLEAEELNKEGEFAQFGGTISAEATREVGRARETQAYGQAIGIGAGMYGKYGGRGPSGGATYNPSQSYMGDGTFNPPYSGGTPADPAYG